MTTRKNYGQRIDCDRANNIEYREQENKRTREQENKRTREQENKS